MATRASDLPDEQVQNEVQGLRKDLDEIKTKQIVGGDNLLTYFGATEGFIERTLSPYDIVSFRYSFTGVSGARSYSQPHAYVNAVGTLAGDEYVLGNDPDPDSVNSTTTTSYLLHIYNGANTITWQVRFGYRTIEEGEITWQEI